MSAEVIRNEETEYEKRYLSIFYGGDEWRAPVWSVQGSKVYLEHPPQNSGGSYISLIPLSARVENTTTQHYQIFDRQVRPVGYFYDGSTWTSPYDSQLIPTYQGGKLHYARKGHHDNKFPINVVPGYQQDTETADAKAWKLWADLGVIDDYSMIGSNDEKRRSPPH